MRAKTGNRIILLALLAVVISGRRAEAQVSDEATCGTSLPPCSALRLNCCTRDFPSTATSKAILIPMDRCHQQYGAAGSIGLTVSDAAPAWCADNSGPQTNAQNYAYGLVYRLMQNKIPVYWIVNPSKAPSTTGITASSAAAQTKDVDFWILTSTAAVPGPAASLTSTTGAHVKRLAPTSVGTGSLAYGVGTNYTRDQFPIRGGAFLIAPEDRTAFDNFMKSSLGRSTCGSGLDCYNFIDNSGVFLYEVQVGAKFVWQDYSQPLVAGKYVENANQLPVALRIDYAPPKVAVIPGTTMLGAILDGANLGDVETTASCKTGTFTVNKAIGCQLTEADVTTSNRLVTTVFDNAWIDLNPASCSTFLPKVQAFATSTFGVTNGGNVIMFGDSINSAEQCTGLQGALLGLDGTGLSIYGSAVNDSTANPFIVRYPGNLLSQYGDMDLNFASGSVKAWDRVTSATTTANDLYDAAFTVTSSGGNTLRRLMTHEVAGANCTNHSDLNVTGAASAAGCDSTVNNTVAGDFRDAFAYGRYGNNKRNGLIFYSPGQNPNTNPVKSHMKLLLGTLIAVPPFLVDQVFTNVEVTRSSPVVASVGGTPSIVQGSYEYHYKTEGTPPTQFTVPRTIPTVFLPDDIASWSFPAILGHVRGVAASSVDISPLDLSAGTSTMDAASGEGSGSGTFPPVVYAGCAPPYNGTCRGIWTATGNGTVQTFQQVNESNTAVQALMLPETSFAAVNPFTSRTYRADFVRKILKGWDDGVGYVPRLGGVDRSTAAVIGPGESVGASRATIVYVGAMDGMLHAICAEVNAALGCPRVGMELWAFIPRVNLPQLRYNQARVDGSPRVMDVRLSVGSKTLLFVQAGLDPSTSGSTPAIYALDITDPQNPSVFWEYATFDTTSTVTNGTPSARPTNGLGLGLTLAAGQAIFTTPSTNTKNVVIAQTNNGGTGNNGNYVIAIDVSNATKLWDKFYAYPSSTVSTGLFLRGAVPAIDIPSNAIPPGPVPIDKTKTGKNGFMTDIVVGDLYGNLWLLDPETGVSRTLSATSVEIPLFQFTTDYHPIAKPAIYSEGDILYAAFVTGGYHDYSTSSPWGFNAATQHLVAVNLNSTSGTAPISEIGAPNGNVPVFETITGYGYAQPRIVDQEIFATSDTTNINLASFGTSASDTGRISAYNIALNAAITGIGTTRAGAGSVINNGTDLYVSSGNKRQHLQNTAGTAQIDSSGVAGERTTLPNQVTQILKKLWLRTE